MPTALPQIAGYIPAEMHKELDAMVERNRRLSLSSLVWEAFEISMEELRKRYSGGSLEVSGPTHERARRRRRKVSV